MLSNLDEYDDPVIYDSENPLHPSRGCHAVLSGPLSARWRARCWSWAAALAALRFQSRRPGLPITGLDVVPGMHARARAKSDDSDEFNGLKRMPAASISINALP